MKVNARQAGGLMGLWAYAARQRFTKVEGVQRKWWIQVESGQACDSHRTKQLHHQRLGDQTAVNRSTLTEPV